MLQNMQAIAAGTWKPHFEWNAPDWKNFGSPDSGAVGFNIARRSAADNKTRCRNSSLI